MKRDFQKCFSQHAVIFPQLEKCRSGLGLAICSATSGFAKPCSQALRHGFKKHFRQSLLLVLSFVVLVGAPALGKEGGRAINLTGLRTLPIQSRGRIKPLDTLAKESVQFITGKTRFQKIDPLDLFLTWVNDPETWIKKPFILVSDHSVKQTFNLSIEKKYFSPEELFSNESLLKGFQTVESKRNSNMNLLPFEEKIATVRDRLSLFQSAIEGHVITFIPHKKDQQKPWATAVSFPSKDKMSDFGYEPKDFDSLGLVMQAYAHVLEAHHEHNETLLSKAVLTLKEQIRSVLPTHNNYPFVSNMNREVHYNHLRPFQKSWFLYLISLILFLISLLFSAQRKSAISVLAFVSMVFAFCLHSYGFYLRCMIAGRAPVTNMYESMIWVAWGAILFGIILWAFYKKYILLFSALVFAILVMIFADGIPTLFDPGLHPLTPVLRDNFWLTIHVLTITLSYAALSISYVLGNITLGYYIFSPGSSRIQSHTSLMYKAIQIGVLLLAAGTILGGVWADYSWGRFWGWDPKEVWALIALLFYLAVLHGRYAGWLKTFGFAVFTTLSFLGVLMAWYGVNFVLGVGLHSYGFGTGGLSYVLIFVIVQLIYTALAYSRYTLRKK